MKFDCLLTNPPYQDSSHAEKKNTLWRKWLLFNKELLNEGGVFSLVIPSSWMGSPPVLKESFFVEKKIKYNLTYINRDECKRHFPSIGSTFSYFVMENKEYLNKTSILSKNLDGKIEVVNDLNLNDCIIDVFPRDLSDCGLSIIRKTLNNGLEKLGIINNTYTIVYIEKNGI